MVEPRASPAAATSSLRALLSRLRTNIIGESSVSALSIAARRLPSADNGARRYEISLTRVGLVLHKTANSAREPTNNSHASPTSPGPLCPPPPARRKLSYLSLDPRCHDSLVFLQPTEG
ncbi:unnamed protein product [Colias eurytheme]|nr:unnamed protein product [Colias eurytheme]